MSGGDPDAVGADAVGADAVGADAAEADAAEVDTAEANAVEDDAAEADVSPTRDPPGAPLTRRTRVKSAALWGVVGGFAFLVLAQGYLLVGGALPFAYAGLFVIATAITGASGGLAYATEHRLRAKRRT